jgi:hypothetical protein
MPSLLLWSTKLVALKRWSNAYGQFDHWAAPYWPRMIAADNRRRVAARLHPPREAPRSRNPGAALPKRAESAYVVSVFAKGCALLKLFSQHQRQRASCD